VTVRRERVVAATPEAVWKIVGDPHHLPRWWPRVERVEAVEPTAWTSVMRSERGKVVRADYRVETHEPPLRRVWVQELTGSPFERLLSENRTEVSVTASGDGAAVKLTVRQRPRGSARLGGFLVRRATSRSLEDALATLAGLVESAPGGP
jgi:uncharacterized protein YndB with AHSA1/START domain